jgi:hypothetical protein
VRDWWLLGEFPTLAPVPHAPKTTEGRGAWKAKSGAGSSHKANNAKKGLKGQESRADTAKSKESRANTAKSQRPED